MRSALRLLGVLVLLALAAPAGAAPGRRPVRVTVPEPNNLQWMTFWVAQAGGLFEAEGVDVTVEIPPSPGQARVALEAPAVDAAVVPSPILVGLVAEGAPWVLVASLLRHEPIDLVVRADVAEARHLRRDAPLTERLLALRGARIGVAPHPPPRLRATYAAAGLDLDKEAELVLLGGREQNAALRSGRVDALFAHTPFLEQAIVADKAFLLVEPARGEVPTLAGRLVHGFVVRRAFLEAHPLESRALVRGLAAAADMIRTSPARAVEILARAYPARDRRELETIVDLYRDAVPIDVTDVTTRDLERATELLPAGMPAPSFAGKDLRAFVSREVSGDAAAARLAIAAAFALSAAVALLLAFRARRPA